MNMAEIGFVIGIMIWLSALYFTIKYWKELVKIGIALIFFLLLAFCLGMAFACNGIFQPQAGITYKLVKPTIVIKTNNTTFITYMIGEKVVLQTLSKDASLWNNTNIMIKVIDGGRSCLGVDVGKGDYFEGKYSIAE